MPDRSGKFFQKTLSLLIALCLLVTILPAVTAEGRDVPFAAKLAAGTVFYADQDLKTETGTLVKDAVVLVTEEKGKADHISYKLEGKTAQSWIPKEAAATILAATPTDLAPYLPDENLTLTPPAAQEETPDTTPIEGEQPTDPSALPTEGESAPSVILSEGEAGVEESDNNPSETQNTTPTEGEPDPSVIPSEGEVIGNEQSPWDGAATIDDAVTSSEPLSDGEVTEGDPVPSVIPSEVEESSTEPLSDGEATEGDPFTPSESPAPATPTDLEPEPQPRANGHLDDSEWHELVEEETAEDPSYEEALSGAVYELVDGQLVTTAYIPQFYNNNDAIQGETALVLPSQALALPEIRNQNPYGTCWAFSAIGGMEIDLIKDGNATTDIDLSEFFLVYFAAHNFAYEKIGMGQDNIEWENDIEGENYLDIGGNNTMAYRILANLIGTTEESANLYPTGEQQDKVPGSYDIAAQLTGAYLLDTTKTAANIQTIKDMISAHGSVGASIWAPGASISPYFSYYSSSGTTTCLYGNYPRTNHDILLVGWDDNFSRSNFKEGYQPPNNGAWLVRNSWGYNGFGQNGYFWLSYDDVSLTARSATAYDAAYGSGNIDQYAYSYDKTPYPDTFTVISDKSEAKLVQTFTIHSYETIYAVGVDTDLDKPTDVLDVSVKVTAGGQTATGSKTGVKAGFYRIDVSPKISSTSSDMVVTLEVTYTARTSGMQILVPYQRKGRGSLGGADASYTYTAGIDGGGFTINGTRYEGDPRVKIYTRDSGTGVKATGISLNRSEIKNAKNTDAPYQLVATVTPSNATNKHVTWSSSNNAVATVDQNGKVTIGEEGGEAVITAVTASGGHRATCKVTVPVAELTGLAITGCPNPYVINNDNAGSFWFGSTLKLGVQRAPAYTTQRDVMWESSNEDVLEILDELEDGSCLLQARGNGTTRITVESLYHSNIKAEVQIIIDLHKKVTSVSLDRTSVSILTDDRLKLNATVSPSNADNKNVIWSSSDATIVSVDGYGYIYGQRMGTATITATTVDGAKTASCTVEVFPRDPVEAFIFRMYRVCLRRDPDEGGFRYWVDKLNSGKKTGAEAVFNFYDSKEMKNSNLSNDQYLIRAYEGIMGRAPDAGGYAYWMERMESGMSRPFIISGFLASREFDALCRSYGINKGSYSSSEPRDKNMGVTGFIARLYTKLQGRMYDEGGLNYWCNIVLKDPVRATLLKVALDGFLHSNEFVNKHLNDTEYLRVLYRAFLDREADVGGMEYWMGKMRSGMNRDKVAEGFASSNEFKAIMARYGFTK